MYSSVASFCIILCFCVVVDHLCLSVWEKWPYVRDTLWGPVTVHVLFVGGTSPQPTWVPGLSCLEFPKMAGTNFSVPRGHPFASVGDSPGSAGGSDLGCFQILPLHWFSEYMRFFGVLFKRRVSVSYSPPSLPCTSIPAFKAGVLGACPHGAGPPGCRVWCGAWTPHSLGRTSAIVIILWFVGCLPRVVCLDSVCVLLHLLPVLLWFLLSIFSHGNFFC